MTAEASKPIQQGEIFGMTRKEFMLEGSIAGGVALASVILGKNFLTEKGEDPKTLEEKFPALEGLTQKQKLTFEFQLENNEVGFEVLNYTDRELNNETLSQYLAFVALVSESNWQFDYNEIPGASITFKLKPEHQNQDSFHQFILLPQGVDIMPQVTKDQKISSAYTLLSTSTPETWSVVPIDTFGDYRHMHTLLLIEMCQAVVDFEGEISFDSEENKKQAEQYLQGMLNATGDQQLRFLGREVFCNSLGVAMANHMIPTSENTYIPDIEVRDRFTQKQYKLIEIPQIFYNYMPDPNLPPIIIKQ